MKGSPILATVLACLIMFGMYAGMRVAFSQDARPTAEPQTSVPTAIGEVSVYTEIYFSNQPKSFSISHPASGRLLVSETDLDSSEWSGELIIPVEKLTSKEIEFLGKVEWESQEDGYHFMQVIISPTDLNMQSSTLRAEGDITDIMKFHWRENE